MPNLFTALLAKPSRATAALIGAGALLLLLGGIGGNSDAADASPAVRHGTVRQAAAHLDGLRHLTAQLGGADAPATLDRELKQSRAALGADMIALRELATPGEETALHGTLAALALYQTAWIDARDRTRAHENADEALAATVPLGAQAAGALASLGHVMDAGNAVAGRRIVAAERAGRYWNAGLALVAAGMLLFATARLQGAGRLDGARLGKSQS